MKNQLKSVISLTLICAVVAVLLAVTNYITAPLIKEQENSAVNASLIEVLPEGTNFQKIEDFKDMPEAVAEAYEETNGKGYVFKLVTTGYASGFTIMCGVDSEGTVTGAVCIGSNETLGQEKSYGLNFVGTDIDTVNDVDTVANATLTTAAYKAAVRDAINAATVLGGGTAQKTEEEIFYDKLSEALPEAAGEFIPVFLTEEIPEEFEVYEALNHTGFVFVKDDVFVGVDKSGNANADSEIKTTVENYAKAIINSELTEIDITGFEDMPAQVKTAYQTQSGNYVFTVRAAGYGITGNEYSRSNEYIYIKVSVTPQGKIISCVTVSQKESENIGDVCAKPEYYTQFNGTTADEAAAVDTVTGATVTTDAYRLAVSKVFEAVAILEGGAE